MGWMEFILAVATLVFGTGWLWTYRAHKRKANGEATVAEAEGWIKQQEAYHNSIEEWKNTCEFIRKDRDELRKENEEWRNKYRELEEQFAEFKKQQVDEMNTVRAELARQGRKLEGVLPFTCGLAGCGKRTRVEIQDQSIEEGEE